MIPHGQSLIKQKYKLFANIQIRPTGIVFTKVISCKWIKTKYIPSSYYTFHSHMYSRIQER